VPYCFSTPGLPFVGFPVFPCSPHHRGALRPLTRGRHKPAAGFLPETHAPFEALPEAHCQSIRKPAVADAQTHFPSAARRDQPNGDGLRKLTPSWALLPYSAFRIGGPLLTGPAGPATFRPQRFPRSRRLSPPETFRAYFIPVTLLGFDLQGFIPPEKQEPLSRPHALLPFDRRSHDREVTRDRAGFRALLPSGIRTLTTSCYAIAKADTLLAFLPLRFSPPPR